MPLSVLSDLPYYPETKYLVVARDMRDAYLSWHNHCMKLGIPANEDLHEFWFDWIKDGAGGHAPIAKDDAPHPHFRFYVSWWQYRHLGNILLVEFSDLLQDLRGEIERIAKFLQFQLDDAAVDAVTQATTFRP